MKIFFSFLLIVFCLLPFNMVFANIPVPDDASSGGQKPVRLTNPLGTTLNDDSGNPSINKLIGQIINAVLGIVGSLALAMFIYGGLTWMTAAGAADKVQKGKDILMWAAVGLVVVFTSYAMVKFVLDSVIGGGAA